MSMVKDLKGQMLVTMEQGKAAYVEPRMGLRIQSKRNTQ